MIGLSLLTIKPNPAGAWRWCSGLTFAVLFLFGIETTMIFRGFDPAQLRRSAGFTFYLFAILGTAATLFQLYNVAILGAFWPFFTGIVVQLLAAMFQFVRIILLPPEQHKSDPN